MPWLLSLKLRVYVWLCSAEVWHFALVLPKSLSLAPDWGFHSLLRGACALNLNTGCLASILEIIVCRGDAGKHCLGQHTVR
jgi:hypothetical protein